MKVLTIQEPCATAIMMGLKTIETRNWRTNYRGRLYIHAASTRWKYTTSTMTAMVGDKLNYGKVICSCDLVDCVLMTPEFIDQLSPQELALGIYEPGRYAWILDNVEVLETPFVTKGHLGIWNLEVES